MTPAKIKFLISLGNLIKTGGIKKFKEALAFARRQFGEIDDAFFNDILNVFRKEGKTKKGDVVSIKKNPLEEVIDKKFGKDTYKKSLVRGPEEFATRKEYERYLDETLGPPDDVFGSPLKDDLLKEWDKVNAKNVTPDIKKVIDEKEGDDFIDFVRKSGDEEGANKIQKEVDRLNKAIEDADKRVKATDRLNFIPGGSRYAEGNLRTAIRQFLRTEEKAGRIKLNETDSFRIREYSPMNEDDPIDVFRRYYGEDALDAADAMADKLQYGESFKHYEEIFRKNMPDLKVKVKGAGEYDDSVKAGEELRKLSEFDPGDRKPNAEGGLIDILKL